ncbi:hypothetical protein GCM10009850_089780 [Nonomuraea monospora]|uniref:Uncharacterized protein n=1 Tax=Nonomuraea monospora TaxID=568818 RepID=A0ABN3CVL2_9ACTN
MRLAAEALGLGNWMLTHGGPYRPEVVRDIVGSPAVRISD